MSEPAPSEPKGKARKEAKAGKAGKAIKEAKETNEPKEPKEPKVPKAPKESGASKRTAGGGGGGSSKRKKGDDADEDMMRAGTPDVDEDVDLVSRTNPAIGAAVVVIHPGSTSLRIGLGEALTPRVIPHCIAYRRKAASAPSSARSDGSGTAIAQRLESSLAPLARQLRLGVQFVGEDYPPVAPSARALPPSRPHAFLDAAPKTAAAVAAAVSTAAAAVAASASAARAHAKISVVGEDPPPPSFLVGEAALLAAHAEPDVWEVVYPLAWGALNTHGTGLSERALYSAIEQIWRCAICGGGGEPGLDVRPAALAGTCAVLALPDLFDRRMGAELLQLLLAPSGLGLKAALVHEEAACAAFGAGVGSACVVDVGNQRASVRCS